MKIRWLSFSVFLVLCGARLFAFESIHIEATLDVQDQSLTGRMSVTLQAETAPFNDLRLRLYPNMLCDTSWCGITVDSLFAGGTNLTSLILVHGTDLYVDLPPSLKGAKSLEVTAWFTTRIPGYSDRFGYFEGHYALESWFPMPAPRRNGQWLNIQYSANSEPVADFFDFDVTFRCPDSLQAIAPGLTEADTLGDTLSAHFALPQAHEFPILVGRGYLLDTTTVGAIIVKIYYQPNYSFVVDSARASITRTLNYMSDYVLPYPYREMIAVIGTSLRGGLELPRMVWLLGPQERSTYRLFGVLIIHELVHQWFYGMINTNQALDPWMDESVTEYFTVKVNRAVAGEQANYLSLAGFTASLTAVDRFRGRQYMDFVPIVWPASQYTTPEYFGAVYSKGMMVLKTLTGLMGSDGERQFWREYAQTYQLKSPTPADFYAVADKYLPKEPGADAASIVGMVDALDFEMLSVEFKELKPEDSSRADSAAPAPIVYKSRVDYSATQPLGMPVTVRLMFDDKTSMDTTVVPVMGHNTIEVKRATPVIGAVIDPDFIYAVDLNYLNNAYVPGDAKGAGLRVFSGFTYLLELLYSALWGI